MLMKGRLIVTDLDGTLLNDHHEVSDSDCDWIETFKKHDGLFTVATGRMNEAVGQFIKELNITVPIITYNGAQIYCPEKNKVLYEKSLSLSTAMIKQLIVAAQSFAEILIFYNDHVFTFKQGKLIKQFEQKEQVKSKTITVKQIPLTVTKVVIMSNEKRKLAQFETLFKQLSHHSNLTYSEPNYLEILPENVSKGEALRELKERFSLQDMNTVAFGNNLNDVSLLQEANVGVAVKNADDGLLNVADHISCYTNNEGAVGRYIETLLTKSAHNI